MRGKKYVDNLTEDRQIRTACFVRELVLLREKALELSSEVDLSRDELDQLINFACTC